MFGMSSITKIFFLAIFFAVMDTFSFFFNPSPVEIEFLPPWVAEELQKRRLLPVATGC
jgi:hypothetical protein